MVTSRRDNEQDNTNNFKYLLASINAKLFQDRLILLGAVRRDTYFFRSVQQLDKGDYPLDWNATNTLYRPAAPAEYYKLTFRQRDASGTQIGPEQEAAIRPRDSNGNRDPLYRTDRFKDDFNSPPVEGSMVTRSVGSVYHFNRFINPTFNFAETFNPPLGLVRIDGSLLKPTVATGLDFGWRMELLENRLHLNFTYYRSKEINGIISGDGPTYFNTLYDANPVGDLSTVGRNKRGAGALPVQYRDTRTRTGDGYELEVVANPMRGLRLTGSISIPKVCESDLNPDVKSYIDKNMDLFKQIANDAGVLVDANNVATVDLSIPINQRSPDANNATTAFNNIVAFRKNIIEGKRTAQNQPTANFFADYTIQGERLKGLRQGRSAQANLAVNNLLNDRGPIWIPGSSGLRQKNNDYTSPAREAVPITYTLKKPINYNLTLTWKL